MTGVPQLIVKFELIDHGLEHPDYFQGCGVALTKYEACFTGIGATPYEAAHEALELATHDYSWNDVVFDECETEIEETLQYRVEAIPDDSDATYHVSIRIGYVT
jgi:hypothetical protein